MNEDLKNQVVKLLEDEQNELDGALDNQSNVIAPSTIPKITITQNDDGTWSKNTEEVKSNMVDGSIDQINRNVIKSKANTLQEFCKIVDNKILTINNQIDTIKQQIIVLSTKATNGNCWPGVAASTILGSPIYSVTKSFVTNSTIKGETENIKIYPNMAGPGVNYGAVNVFEPDTIYRLTSSYAGYGYKNLPENVLLKNKDGTATGLNTDGSGSTLGNGRFDISTTLSSHQSSTFSSVGVGTTAIWTFYYPGAGVSPLASDTSVTASECVSIANSITSLYNQIISLRNEKDSLRADLDTIKDNKKEKELASWGMNRIENQIKERKTKNVSAIASVKSFNSNTTVNTNALVFHLDAGDSNSYSGVGTSWNDLSGFGNTTNIAPEGLTAATLEFSNGKFFTFNGTNQYAETVNKNALTNTSSWTMEVWFKINGAPSDITGSNVIVDTNPTGSTGNVITVDYGGAFGGSQNQLVYASRPSGGSYTNLLGPVLQNGYWYHAVVVRNGTTNTKLYTNGSLSATFSGNLPTESQSFTRIARFTDATYFSNISVSVIKIYQRSFTDEEVKIKFEESKRRYSLIEQTS